MTTTTDVEEEVLSEVEVELVDELRHEGIARSDAATLLSEVTAAGDELLEAVCHLLVGLSLAESTVSRRFAGLVSDRSGEVAVSDFVLRGDVSEVIAQTRDRTSVTVGVTVVEDRVATTRLPVVDDTDGRSEVLSILYAVVELTDDAVTHIEVGVRQLLAVDIARVVVAPVRSSLRARTVVASLSLTEGIGNRSIEAVAEVLRQRSSEVVAIAEVVAREEDQIRVLLSERSVDLVDRADLTMAMVERTVVTEKEVAVAYAIEVARVHPFERSTETTGELGIESEV